MQGEIQKKKENHIPLKYLSLMTHVLYCSWESSGYFIVHNLKGRMLLQCIVVNSEKVSSSLTKILFNGGFVVDFVGNA